MALPGGLRGPADPDLASTALRETLEEVAIVVDPGRDLLGTLPDVAPATPLLPSIVITPIVAAVPPGTEATPDPREVDAAVWVPLDALRDEHAVSEILIELKDGTRAFPSLRYGEYVIWGLTHRIISQFMERVEAAGL
jgi:8-oxo-dGTP pyrophosphatase MutT (NUDIX family)